MAKEQFQIEHILKNGSAHQLWKYISTAAGLSEWFADDVNEREGVLTFRWDNTTVQAERVAVNNNVSAKYHWCEDADNYYFELRIDHSELTGGVVLLVTDFAEPSEKNSSIELWNSQIEILIRRTGM